ncbi:MAG: hypothetical protein IH884_11090, partial [Myxococcales bacterium]|nr:hypothetical protein [Myxococcales bacterium]
MLLRTVSQAIQKLGLQGRTVVVAVSGGVDSVCLLTLLHELAEEYSLKLLIGHVNHGLRGAESEADQAAVQALGQALGMPVVSVCVDPKQERQQRSSRDRPTLQEAARRVRYRALESIVEEHNRLADPALSEESVGPIQRWALGVLRDPTVPLPEGAVNAEAALRVDRSGAVRQALGKIQRGTEGGSLTRAEAAVEIVDVVESFGLRPVEPPTPLDPITEEDVGVVCWMGVIAET